MVVRGIVVSDLIFFFFLFSPSEEGFDQIGWACSLPVVIFWGGRGGGMGCRRDDDCVSLHSGKQKRRWGLGVQKGKRRAWDGMGWGVMIWDFEPVDTVSIFFFFEGVFWTSVHFFFFFPPPSSTLWFYTVCCRCDAADRLSMRVGGGGVVVVAVVVVFPFSPLACLHWSNARSHPSLPFPFPFPGFSSSVTSPHRSATTAQVLLLTILSTAISFLSNVASRSVRGSSGENRPLYGSRRSLTTRFRSASDCSWRRGRVGSSGSGEVATWEQYSSRSVRADQVGKRMVDLKVAHASGPMGRREAAGRGSMVVVVLWVRGLLVEGVTRALRCVEMESSMLLRERRKNSEPGALVEDRPWLGGETLPRTARSLKQSCGVKVGDALGWAMMRGGAGFDW